MERVPDVYWVGGCEVTRDGLDAVFRVYVAIHLIDWATLAPVVSVTTIGQS